MKKVKITIEHVLAGKSTAIIWKLISTPEGLSRWMADGVSSVPRGMEFRWGGEWDPHEVRVAEVLKLSDRSRIRFRWKDEEDPAAYVELRMTSSDLTNDHILTITDFAAHGEEDVLRGLWEGDLRRLREVSGL